MARLVRGRVRGGAVRPVRNGERDAGARRRDDAPRGGGLGARHRLHRARRGGRPRRRCGAGPARAVSLRSRREGKTRGARRGSGARTEGREKVRVATARAAVRGGGEGDAPDLGDGGDGGAVRGAGLEDVRLLSQPLGSARRRVDRHLGFRRRISPWARNSARRPHGRGLDRSPPDGRRGGGRDRGAREVRDLPQLLVRGARAPRAAAAAAERRRGPGG